jgi:hypothetical protein
MVQNVYSDAAFDLGGGYNVVASLMTEGSFIDNAAGNNARIYSIIEREFDRSLHRHVAIGWFVQFLPSTADLCFNRAQHFSGKIVEHADGD